MLSHPELWAFATHWYRLLDVHAPLESFRPLLSEDVELVFPEATVTGFEGYRGWYEKVITIFFDEQHTLRVADITDDQGDHFTAHVVVNWKASIWSPPASSSTRLMMDADQTWDLRRNNSGGLVVSRYVVNGMSYEPGSCKL